MTINLDTEIVATRHEPKLRMTYYTIERGGRRWTIGVFADELDRHGGNRQARRNHVGNLLHQAMQGKADGE
jgi:hypothetical protein